MGYEEIIMQIIVSAGLARSLSMEAIMMAKEGKFREAEELISKASLELGNAHKVQTSLIQREAGGENVSTTLLMIHAQDHLMNTITIKDLALEFIDLHRRISPR